eukprot:TRINITY_DN1101_c6_g1_i2.p1 TRINITY_DN1101_c6_g1~~TRINITY_DN1101_c6_g1_i2.p1  ORF type:complete len:385 (-),score=101.37 TRINITY_DN1101_c6_g1_i2:172-1326(-)
MFSGLKQALKGEREARFAPEEGQGAGAKALDKVSAWSKGLQSQKVRLSTAVKSPFQKKDPKAKLHDDAEERAGSSEWWTGNGEPVHAQAWSDSGSSETASSGDYDSSTVSSRDEAEDWENSSQKETASLPAKSASATRMSVSKEVAKPASLTAPATPSTSTASTTPLNPVQSEAPARRDEVPPQAASSKPTQQEAANAPLLKTAAAEDPWADSSGDDSIPPAPAEPQDLGKGAARAPGPKPKKIVKRPKSPKPAAVSGHPAPAVLGRTAEDADPWADSDDSIPADGAKQLLQEVPKASGARARMSQVVAPADSSGTDHPKTTKKVKKVKNGSADGTAPKKERPKKIKAGASPAASTAASQASKLGRTFAPDPRVQEDSDADIKF